MLFSFSFCLRHANPCFIWIRFANSWFPQVVQKEREEKLAEILKGRLNQYVQGNKEEFVRHAEAEVARLSNAGSLCLYSFGWCFVFATAGFLFLMSLALYYLTTCNSTRYIGKFQSVGEVKCSFLDDYIYKYKYQIVGWLVMFERKFFASF